MARSVWRALDASFSVRLIRKSRWALSLSRGSCARGGPRWWPTGADARPVPPAGAAGGRSARRPRRRGGRHVGPFGLVAAPSAPVLVGCLAVRVEFEHRGHRPLEEVPVVGDDDHPAPARPHPGLEPVQPLEVEVVGRLVEQGDVEPGQLDGGQGHLGLLPARQRGQPRPRPAPRRRPSSSRTSSIRASRSAAPSAVNRSRATS